MIAQKLKNNRIAITSGNVGRKDALETIEDLRVGEFFKLSRAARNWDKSLNDKRDIMFTTYENEHSKVCKEFDAIVARRKAWEEYNSKKSQEEEIHSVVANVKMEENEEKKFSTRFKSEISGTSRLIRVPTKKSIKIVRRKGLSDCYDKVNSICITNKQREEFFADVKKSKWFQSLEVSAKDYKINGNMEGDLPLYEKWDKIISYVFEQHKVKGDISE